MAGGIDVPGIKMSDTARCFLGKSGGLLLTEGGKADDKENGLFNGKRKN